MTRKGAMRCTCSDPLVVHANAHVGVSGCYLDRHVSGAVCARWAPCACGMVQPTLISISARGE